MRNIRWQKMALRAANGLLDGVTALLVLLAVVWSGYALWDNSTVIRPPTPSAEMPDEVIPAAEPEPVGTLIQTGQLLWPVPVLAGGGIALVAVGLWLSRKRRHDA